MALQLTFTDSETGIVYPDTYHYVGVYGFDLFVPAATFYVVVYKDAASKEAGKEGLWLKGLNRFNFEATGQDFLNHFQIGMIEDGEPRSLCYNYLKNVNPQPDLFDYSQAIDI